MLVFELYLLHRTIHNAMDNYQLKQCYLCGFGLDNTTIIPYEETVIFYLRKIYLELYCQVIKYKGKISYSESRFVGGHAEGNHPKEP